MPKYSTNGYPAAVTMRSNRTLLVEGPSDKAAVARLLIELRNNNHLRSDNVLIDTGQDIPDSTGGNRERVEAMHLTVGGSNKFAALVDREFREFDLQGVRDLNPAHCVIPVNLFWTRGHSIENYFSEIEIVAKSLEDHFSEHLPNDFRHHLRSAFSSILQNCASVSLAANAIGRLDRIKTISQFDHWVVKPDGSMEIDLAAIRVILSNRGVTTAECAAFDTEFTRCRTRLVSAEPSLSRWICQGHLAESHVWCAIAAMLRHHGLSDGLAARVGWGEREALVRGSRGVWSGQCASGVGDYPAAFIQWLCG